MVEFRIQPLVSSVEPCFRLKLRSLLESELLNSFASGRKTSMAGEKKKVKTLGRNINIGEL